MPDCDRHDWRTRVFDQIKGLVAVECRKCGAVEDADGVLVELMHMRDDWLEANPIEEDQHQIQVTIFDGALKTLKKATRVVQIKGTPSNLEIFGGVIVEAINHGTDKVEIGRRKK